MLYNLRFIFSLFKYLLFLTSISILLIFCDNENQDQYTGPWVEVPMPAYQGQINACYFITPDDGWACGDRGDGPYPLLFHWNGTEWTEYPYGGWFDGEKFGEINFGAISFSGPDDGWLTGLLFYEYNKSYGFILRYDGTKWNLFQNHLGDSVVSVFALAPNDVWFNVFEDGQGVLYHWDGDYFWKYWTPRSNHGISDIDFYSKDNGIAVGTFAGVWRWNGSELIEINYDPLDIDFREVACDTENTAWIIGEDHTEVVIRLEGDKLTKLWDWKGTFKDVYFTSPDDGWIVGGKWVDEYHTDSWTWHWDGSGWRGIDCPDDMHAWNIFSLGVNDVWIVGLQDGPLIASWRYEPARNIR
jgi:hypothetical protein